MIFFINQASTFDSFRFPLRVYHLFVTFCYQYKLNSINIKYISIGRGGALVEWKPEAFRPEDHEFKSRSSRHIGTLGKSLTCSSLWRFSMKPWHSTRAVSGVLLSSGRLKEVL